MYTTKLEHHVIYDILLEYYKDRPEVHSHLYEMSGMIEVAQAWFFDTESNLKEDKLEKLLTVFL